MSGCRPPCRCCWRRRRSTRQHSRRRPRVSGRRCGWSARRRTARSRSLAEANEIRVVFSEPMVTLGSIPARVTAPFFSVTPAIPGSFRWSGTTILIFTPDAEAAAAVRDQVRGDDRGDRHRGERPPAGAAASVQLHDADRQAAQHQLVPPRRTRRRADGRAAALQPAGSRRRRCCRTCAPSSSGTTGWSRRCPPKDSRTLKAIDPASIAAVQRQGRRDPRRRECDRAGDAAPDHRLGQEAIPAVTGPRRARNDDRRCRPRPGCACRCRRRRRRRRARRRRRRSRRTSSRPSRRSSSTASTARARVRPTSPTVCISARRCERRPMRRRCEPPTSPSPGQPVPVVQAEARGSRGTRGRARRGRVLHARGRRLRSAAAGADVRGDASIVAAFGRRPDARLHLGGLVENWHERAFTSFGDGHGVWERSGGTQLPFYARNFRTVTQWSQRVALPDLMPTILRLQRRRGATQRTAVQRGAGLGGPARGG